MTILQAQHDFIARATRVTLNVAHRTGLISFWAYFWANVWALIPVLAAFVILAIAQNVPRIPTTCAETDNGKANWLLCVTDPNPVAPIFNSAAKIFDSSAKELPKRIDAEVEAANAAAASETAPTIHATPSPNTNAKDAGAVPTSPLNGLKSDVAIAASEARGRLAWSVSFGVLVAIALVVGATAIPFIWLGIRQHHNARSLPGFPWRYVVQFIVFSAALAVVLLELVTRLVSAVLLRPSPPLDSLLNFLRIDEPIYRDNIMAWLSSYAPQLQKQIGISVLLLTVSLSLVAMLVTSTLYQWPSDSSFRMSDVADPQDPQYVRYLGRSFGRLKVAVYLGAALLVATVAEVAARYAWPVTLLTGSANAELSKALTDLGQQITSEVGLGFTLLLAALYFPAITILRQRGRDFYRSRHPLDSLDQQEAFLTTQGLTLKMSSAYGDFIALLAPAGAAFATHVFTISGS